MESKIRFRFINRLAAILFAILPVMSLLSSIRLLLDYPDMFFANFSIYLLFLRCAAYFLLALTLFRQKSDKLFVCSFTLPVVISLISFILPYGKVMSLLDLLTFGSLYFVVLGAKGYLPRCKKAAQCLCLLPGILGAIRQIFSATYSLMGILFSICYVIALLVTGIWALEQAKEETPQPPIPVTKLPGIGLIMFGALFLISKAVDVTQYYLAMARLIENMSSIVPFTWEIYFGASPIELLIYVIVSICAMYGGILLYYKKTPAIE